MSHAVVFVLDATTGRPVEGLGVRLQRRAEDGAWVTQADGTTDAAGEIRKFRAAEAMLAAGEYRLVYATQAYFEARGVACFHPEVTVLFRVADESRHVLPLILSPFGYSTYRGS